MAFRLLRGPRCLRPSSLAFGSPAPSPRTTLHPGMLPTTTLLPHATPASCRWRSPEREAILREKVVAKYRKKMQKAFDKGEDIYDPNTPQGQEQLDKMMRKYDIKRNSSDDAKRRRKAAKKRENQAKRMELKRQNNETAKSSAVLDGLSTTAGMNMDEFKAAMGSAWRSNEEFNQERFRREAREEEDESDEGEEDEGEESDEEDEWSKERRR